MRVAGLDTRVQQAKNLFTNPSFERGNGSQVERFRNFAQYSIPSVYQTTSTAGIIGFRQSRWFGGGGTPTGNYTIVLDANDGPLPEIRNYARKTWTVAPASNGQTGDTGFDLNSGSGTSAFPVTAGEVYTISCYMRCSVQKYFQISVYNYTSSGAAYSTARFAGGYVLSTPNQWSRVSFSYTVPPGVSFLSFAGDVNSSQGMNYEVGSTLDATGIMVTKTAVVTPFFTGDTTNDSMSSPFGLDYSYVWAGAANASATIVMGPTPGTVVMTNHMPNPCLRGDLASWAVNGGTGGTAALSRVTDTTGPLNQCYARATWSVAPTGGNPGLDFGPNIVTTPNEPVAITLRARCSQAISINAVIDWYTTGGTYISSSTAAKVPVANTWTEFTVTGYAPATAGKIVPHLRPGNTLIQAGMTLDATLVCITKTPVVMEFFDAVFQLGKWADLDFTGFWTGTVNTSASVLRGVSPVNVSGSSASASIQSFKYPTKGKKSLRIITTLSSTRDSYADLLGMTVAGASNTLVKGKTYTLLVKSYQEGPLTNPTGGNRPRSTWVVTTGGTQNVSTPSTAGPNVAGYYQQRLVFTMNHDDAVSYRSIRLINGADVGGGDIWWDEPMLVEGNYSSSYIDGDNIGCRWLGIAHASQSVGYPFSV